MTKFGEKNVHPSFVCMSTLKLGGFTSPTFLPNCISREDRLKDSRTDSKSILIRTLDEMSNVRECFLFGLNYAKQLDKNKMLFCSPSKPEAFFSYTLPLLLFPKSLVGTQLIICNKIAPG